MNDRHADGHTAGKGVAMPDQWYAIRNPQWSGAKIRIARTPDEPWANFGEIAYVVPAYGDLVAAAPTMLAALREAREQVAQYNGFLYCAVHDERSTVSNDSLRNGLHKSNSCLATIDAAIQQATGGSDE